MGFLQELREANTSRRERWQTGVEWSGADWSNAMCGEAGEAANIVKKLRRLETGVGSRSDDTRNRLTLIDMLADEMGDIVAYLDLLAAYYGIDLQEAITSKFNMISIREGFPERLDR